jgi:hypothetical protein
MVRRLHNKLSVSKTDLISSPVLPTLMQDIIDKANKWGNEGKSGRIDPFVEVHHVNFFPIPNFSQVNLLSLARLHHDRTSGHVQ